MHANGSIYTGSGSPLILNGTVTATGTISSPANNGQTPPWAYTGTFNGSPPSKTNVPTVSLSIGTTNVHAMIEIPPVGETPSSSRMYHQAGIVVTVTNDLVTMLIRTSPTTNSVAGADPSPIVLTSTNTTAALATNFPFLITTNTFTDLREVKTVLTTQIDVGKYAAWIATNASVLAKFPASSFGGNYPNILFVADIRGTTGSQMTGVRLTNGVAPPINGGTGFSVATPNPLYVCGNYNCTNAANLGTTNTSSTVPCALMSDALTILSSSWRDANSASGTRPAAANTTINAAILTGTVPSTGTSSTTFSGGVHNLPRLLENWGSDTLTLNTSIMSLYNSTVATRVFVNPTTYYTAPTRQFSFDLKFLDPSKQPPGIPTALVPIRLNLAYPPPNTLTYSVTP